MHNLPNVNNIPNSFNNASGIGRSFNTPELNRMDNASLLLKIKSSDDYPTRSAITSNLMTSNKSCRSLMEMMTHQGTLNTHINSGYGVTGLLASHQNLTSVYPSSFGIYNHTTNMYGGGYCLDHINPRKKFYGTSIAIPMSATNITAATKFIAFAGNGIQQIINSGMFSELHGSMTGDVAILKAMNHKWYGGESIVEYINPNNHFPSSLEMVHFPNHANAKAKWYGGGEVVPSTYNEIFRSNNDDYDHYIVNQKRDAYKSILDNYYQRSHINLIDLSPITTVSNWSEVIVGKITSFVSSLDFYLDTRDASMLHELSHREWEVMALSYSAGMGPILEKFYSRIYSREARDKYARRRLDEIIEQRLKIKYKLDLRIIFRYIICFLFKNMDDEFSESNVELSVTNNIFSLKNSIHYARVRFNNSVKHAA